MGWVFTVHTLPGKWELSHTFSYPIPSLHYGIIHYSSNSIIYKKGCGSKNNNSHYQEKISNRAKSVKSFSEQSIHKMGPPSRLNFYPYQVSLDKFG